MTTNSTFESNSLNSVSECQTPSVSNQGEVPEGSKPKMEVRDINDVFRLLSFIHKADKTDSIKDLQTFCKEAFIFFEYEKLSAKNQKGLNDTMRNKKSMKKFMMEVKVFLFQVIYDLGKN
jgi:hypothetical protein